MQAVLAELELRERVLLFLDMVTGLRRGELTGIKWEDIDFEKLEIHVQRSVVEQVVGRCKTETSQKSIPLDELTAQDPLRSILKDHGHKNGYSETTAPLRFRANRVAR